MAENVYAALMQLNLCLGFNGSVNNRDRVIEQDWSRVNLRAYWVSDVNGIWCFHLEVAIDKQGRIVIPKEIREKYGLSQEGKLELVAREDAIELIPQLKKTIWQFIL